jgi:hypothetical protein
MARFLPSRCTSQWLVALLLASTVAAQIPGPVDAAEFARRTSHWAWQPLRTGTPPAAGHPVDAFVDQRLTAAGLRRSPPAEPHVQLRRLWFDLAGLPPPVEAVQRFAADPSDAAWAREVDALLASPHYGERQARHWLDLVRYAETLGHEFDYELPNAWRYRDYVIRAFDADVPFDQFVREHVAGDLLPTPRRDANGSNESVQGTAHFWFVEQTHAPVDAARAEADRLDNQVDVLGKAVLGLTVACARCHDHKFDAIRAADYYALTAFVRSSRYVQAPIAPIDFADASYRAVLDLQRQLPAAWANAATGDGWDTLRTQPPEQWLGEDTAPLRGGETLIAHADGLREHWFVTNDGFGEKPWRGPFCPDPKAEQPRLLTLPGAFWNSAVGGTGREGTLATRTFAIEQRYLHVRAAGQHSRIKVVVDGFHLVRDPIYGSLHKSVDHTDARWLTFDLQPWHQRPAFVSCIDQQAPDLADPHHDRGQYANDAWLAVQAVVASPFAEPPGPTSPPLPPPGFTEVPGRVQALTASLDLNQKRLPVSPTVPGLGDGSGQDGHVLVRGDHRRLGAPVPRRFLQALAGDAPLATGPGSGRLALAEAITRADDPLLPRVRVNRLWHQLFGRGLVRSVDNLGALGDPPSHPELLDWLARDFQANGWSHKHALRLLCTSATYRQDSRRRDDAEAADAANLLLHRQNVRRLDAESVRDAVLACSGRLDATRFGPSVPLPLDGVAEARGRPGQNGPLDGAGRRSIYLAVRRNFLAPLLQAFDQPTPFATVGARNVSNVPAQALALANDPFVHAQAAAWATATAAEPSDDDARLRAAWQRAFGRSPEPDELARCRTFLAGGGDTAWADLLHALLQATELLYLR